MSFKTKEIKKATVLVVIKDYECVFSFQRLRSAISGHLKFLDDNSGKTGLLEFCCGEKVFDPVLCKSKQFYELITKKGIVSRGFTKLKKDFDSDDITVSKVFFNLLSVSSETFIRSFQLKLLDDIVFTNKRLAKIGYVLHDTCTFCKVETETTYHALILRMSFYSSLLGKL